MILGDGSAYAMWIPFVLVVVIGHTLNIAMCALGAFVHPPATQLPRVLQEFRLRGRRT